MTAIDTADWEGKFRALVHEMQNVGSDMGLYPAAVKGYHDERDYSQRDGYKNGWNAAVSEYGHALEAAAARAAEGMSGDLQLLLAAGVGWLRDGTLYLNMNDTWAWACADAEEVPAEDVKHVARLFRDYGWPGLLYWGSERNNQMKSEFKDNNRFIEFVRHEERIRQETPDSTARAYRKVTYTLGET